MRGQKQSKKYNPLRFLLAIYLYLDSSDFPPFSEDMKHMLHFRTVDITKRQYGSEIKILKDWGMRIPYPNCYQIHRHTIILNIISRSIYLIILTILTSIANGVSFKAAIIPLTIYSSEVFKI